MRERLGITWPGAFLLFVLFARPLLDGIEKSRVQVAGIAINIAGAVAVASVLVATVVVVRAKPRTWPSGTLPYCAVLIVSGAAAAVGLAELHASLGDKPLQELARLATLGAVAVLAANLAASGLSLRLVFVTAGLSATIPALVGIVQWVRGAPIESGLTVARINGTFTGPNAFGAYLAAAALILIFIPSSWMPHWARLGSLALTLVALVGSFSRTGWSIFFVGILALGWRRHKRIVLVTLAATVVVALVVPSVRDRVFASDVINQTNSSDVIPSSYGWRIDNWSGLLSAYRQRPLVGFGLRSTEYVNPTYETEPDGTRTGNSAHNTVIKLLVEGGPLLVLSWVVFFAVVIAKSWRMARTRWRFDAAARIALALWAVVAFIGMTADDLLAATALMILVFALAGTVEGAWRRYGAEKPT